MSSDWVITDQNWQNFLNPVIDGERKSHGLVPRDYSTHPEGCFAWAEQFPDELLIPEDELDGRLKEQEATKSSLLDLREANYSVLKSLDQDGWPYCWAFSSTKAAMYLRIIAGEPGLIFSAWLVGCDIKNYRQEGGWGGDSLDYIVKNGVPVFDLFPGPRSSYDTPAMRENMALHKVTKWWEGSSDPDKAFHQLASANARGLPGIVDLDWMSHSMCCPKTNSYKSPEVDFDNSWGESSGNKGLYRVQGNRCRPNGLWVPCVETVSLK